MSKHKRLHSITGKSKFAKFAGFVGTHYSPQLKKKAPASSAKAGGGGVEHVDHAVSTSTITENGGFVK